MSSRQTALHVAALPFPTYQGTQAVIFNMLEAMVSVGREPTLLTYAMQGYPYEPGFEHRRLSDFPAFRSLQSGPSLRKVVLDVRLCFELKSLMIR